MISIGDYIQLKTEKCVGDDCCPGDFGLDCPVSKWGEKCPENPSDCFKGSLSVNNERIIDSWQDK